MSAHILQPCGQDVGGFCVSFPVGHPLAAGLVGEVAEEADQALALIEELHAGIPTAQPADGGDGSMPSAAVWQTA